MLVLVNNYVDNDNDATASFLPPISMNSLSVLLLKVASTSRNCPIPTSKLRSRTTLVYFLSPRRFQMLSAIAHQQGINFCECSELKRCTMSGESQSASPSDGNVDLGPFIVNSDSISAAGNGDGDDGNNPDRSAGVTAYLLHLLILMIILCILFLTAMIHLITCLIILSSNHQPALHIQPVQPSDSEDDMGEVTSVQADDGEEGDAQNPVQPSDTVEDETDYSIAEQVDDWD